MNNDITIGLASDHAGFQMKELVKHLVQGRGYKIKDFGCNTTESVDYPDYAHPLALAVESGECNCGIALCGSGNGISMTLNKHQGIRAAICWNDELAKLAKQHNNANVLVLPARFITEKDAADIVAAFLSANFEAGRHLRRIEKIPCK